VDLAVIPACYTALIIKEFVVTYLYFFKRIAAAILTLGLLGLLISPATAQKAPAKPTCLAETQPPTQQQISAAQANARDRGALWSATKDGRTSYLYASIHLGKLDWTFHGPQVLKAFQQTDALALEIDLLDPNVMQRSTVIQQKKALKLPADLQRRLRTQLQVACLPVTQMEAMHPILQAFTVQIMLARHQGLEVAYAQELTFSFMAQQTKKKIISLETVDLQMAALLPSDPKEGIAIVEQMLKQLETGTAKTVLAQLSGYWESGNVEQVSRYEEWCQCMSTELERNYLHRLNDGRNPHLADRIASEHVKQSLFAAVGMLHMTGSQSLPKLLEERGFKVERIVFP
jgi:uncharacterized protein